MTRAALIGSLVVLVIASLCVRLGFWQISRLEQRDARNSLLAQRMNLPPVQLGSEFTDTAGLIYRRVTMEGRYDNDRTIVLPGRSLRGSPGVYVLTPVLLGAGSHAVLVNRGWQPAADGATVNFDSLRIAPEATLTGLVVPFPAASRRGTTASNDTTFRRQWFTPDPEAMQKQFPYTLLDFQVQALPAPDAPRYPIRLQPPTMDRGPHLGYAIQWFSFAVIAIVGWIALMLRSGEVRRP